MSPWLTDPWVGVAWMAGGVSSSAVSADQLCPWGLLTGPAVVRDMRSGEGQQSRPAECNVLPRP